jgi:sporulation protein YlmC with PRC-barrel domain
MKMLPTAAFALAMAASPLALAQSTSSPPANTTPNATSTTPKSSATPNATTSTSNSSSSTRPEWYSHQSGEMRASKLIGTSVKNSAGEKIGDINEVVLGKDGKVAAVVIGVGGFLGLGEREVAVDFNSLRLTQDTSNNNVVTMDATKDSLKAAPQWTWNDRSSGTSTSSKSTGTSTSPATSPPANRTTK